MTTLFIRRRLLSILAALFALAPLSAQEPVAQALFIDQTNDLVEAVPTALVDSLWFSADGSSLHISTPDTVVTRPVQGIVQMYVADEAPAASIHFDGQNVAILNPYFCQGVAITALGGHVAVDNRNTSEELTFALSGSSTDGSLTYSGTFKTTLQLEGVSLKSTNGPALNILCGKRIALLLKKGTVSSLEDAAGDHKGALYCKGHLEVDKGGTLNVTGHAKHAIFTKEYLQLKNGTGIVNICGAVEDGIHAGQYFQMNGGCVYIDKVNGDGIQAEVTDNAADEWNGQLLINGGEVHINVTADEKEALKSDGDMTLTSARSACVIGLKTSGKGSKDIKCDGVLTIGSVDTEDGPALTISTSGARSGSSSGSSTGGGGRPGPGGGGGWNPGGSTSSGSSSKAIKANGAANVYGGELTITTEAAGAEGLESKVGVNIAGGHHYFKCYDDCINSSGTITFNGGITICYATNNDAVDSNYGKAGAITIGDGTVLAYTSKGSPEEGFDCDNNSYIRITGNGYAISAGGAQGGGSSNNTISNAAQGYAFVTSSIRYATNNYYTLADAQGNNLITYRLDAAVSSTLALFTAKGMTKGASYTVKSSTAEPTDAQQAFHGIYLGSTAKGSTSVCSFTAK